MFQLSADCDLHSTFRTSGIDVTNNHTRFSRLPIIAPFMSGKFNVRRYKNVVWITIFLATLNKSDIRRSIVLHVVECECIKHVVDIRVLRVCRVLHYRVSTMCA